MRFTRLGRAVVEGNLELVRKYLDEGDDVNEVIDKVRKEPEEDEDEDEEYDEDEDDDDDDDDDDYYWNAGRLPGGKATPLIAACYDEWIVDFDGEMENIPAIIDLLLDRGADVNYKTSNGATPLLLACRWEGSFVIDGAIKRMVDLGADVNVTFWKAEIITPLSSLCWQLNKRDSTPESDRKRLECIKLLLDKGADPNGKVKDGMSTPLHAALYNAKNGSNAAMQAAVFLISRKADLTIRNEHGYKGRDPEDYAGPKLWAKIKEKLKDISAAKEFGKVRDVPPDVVKNIQEFVVGKKNIQESDVGKKKGGKKTRARKTKRRKTLRRK